ncbi:MAG: amino acid ABC transporter permease [Cohaesibacteraceae bacterium]|nr:amino acid ABC transporter permease [Cohaesibacteraceae bacterium]
MNIFKTIRPSNLVLFAAAPLIIYLFASQRNYQRSLKAILGIEPHAGAIFVDFVFLLVALVAGCILPLLVLRGKISTSRMRKIAWPALGVNLACVLVLLSGYDLEAFFHSVIAGGGDTYGNPWIVEGSRPARLTSQALEIIEGRLRTILLIYLVCVPLLTLVAWWRGRDLQHKTAFWIFGFIGFLNFEALFYIVFVGHLGFATGLMVTLRGAFFAYIFAAALGLVWAGMQGLKPGQYTLRRFVITAVSCLIISGGFFLQDREDYVLVGSLEKRIALIKGTPQSLADTIRFGEYPGATSTKSQLRSVVDLDRALEVLSQGKVVTAAFLPVAQAPENVPVIWHTAFLADKYRIPGIVFAALGILLLVLTFGAYHHRTHPLAIWAEFFIDTIRGIPMLVIILYVGLPLSGAVKSASGGFIDLPNFIRGIIAIAIGYSAYMAEIFRAGIEAIPKGQVEAAQSVGLTRWQVARLVVLPQAIRIVIPPLGNEFIAMLKDTSLLSILSVRDLTQRMREFQAASFLPFAPFNSAAILYVILTLVVASFLKWVERRANSKYKS